MKRRNAKRRVLRPAQNAKTQNAVRSRPLKTPKRKTQSAPDRSKRQNAKRSPHRALAPAYRALAPAHRALAPSVAGAAVQHGARTRGPTARTLASRNGALARVGARIARPSAQRARAGAPTPAPAPRLRPPRARLARRGPLLVSLAALSAALCVAALSRGVSHHSSLARRRVSRLSRVRRATAITQVSVQ